MRLSVITNWAYGATVALTLVSGATMVLAAGAIEHEREAFEQAHRLERAADALDRDVLHLSDRARQYLDTADPTYLTVYRSEISALAPAEARADHLAAAGATPSEVAFVTQAHRLADLLHDEQLAAFEALDKGDVTRARDLLFGAEYERELDKIGGLIDRMQAGVESRLQGELTDAERMSRIWRTVSEIVLGTTAVLFLAVLFFVFRRRVVQPVVKLSDVIRRLAENDFAAEPPNITQIDEIGDMAQAIAYFRDNGLERQRLERERAADSALRERISRMTQRLQTSDTTADLADIVHLFAPHIAPDLAGRLYLFDQDRNAMIEACSWSKPQLSSTSFPPMHCWALRRGIAHRPGGEMIDMPCQHLGLEGAMIPDTICLPLMAQQEMVGLLYLERLSDYGGETATSELYLDIISESIGMALANLRLRDRLQEMAMKDPLTGLANRRELDRQVSQLAAIAAQGKAPLSCLMIDVDHFKRFNDTHGHEAGDAVLCEVGQALQGATDQFTTAFRYGGEEFTVLAPGADSAAAVELAEEIRHRISGLRLVRSGRDLGSINVSIGVSTLSGSGDGTRLIAGADGALLRAKEAGRNRVEVDRREDVGSGEAAPRAA